MATLAQLLWLGIFSFGSLASGAARTFFSFARGTEKNKEKHAGLLLLWILRLESLARATQAGGMAVTGNGWRVPGDIEYELFKQSLVRELHDIEKLRHDA